MIWWIIFIVLWLLLFVATRNLYKYDDNRNLVPLKFPIWVYIIITILLWLPIFNLITFVACIVYIVNKINDGENNRYTGWYLQEGKTNFAVKIYNFFTKEI